MKTDRTPVLHRAHTPGSILTDGERTFSNGECCEILEKACGELLAQGVGPEDILDFHCEHGLAAALLWLAFLEGGWSFFVNAVAPCYQASNPPPFCRFSVRARWREDRLVVETTRNHGWNGATAANGQTVYFQTSGTTGSPKLVAHSAAKLLRNAANCVARLEIDQEARVTIPVPLFHMYGAGAAFLPAALAGASMEIQSGSNLPRFIQREKIFQPDIAFLTPSFMQTLVKGRRDPRGYALTVSAGDILKPEIFARYEEKFGPVISLYGSTELGAIAAGARADPRETRAHSVGRPMPGVDCRIEEGHLLCRHDSGFAGYADERGVWVERDEWFCTRDLAEWSPDGRLRLHGRLDNSVNRDGVLISLADVERAVEAIPEVESAKAVAAGTSLRGKGIVVFCLLKPGMDSDPATLREACFASMRRGHVPDRIVIVDRFPLLPGGKADRAELVRLAEEGA
jgi:acyl-coenzyme A synthetase/AMP-(fatty) acid ligase